jgi:hypothetical protein
VTELARDLTANATEGVERLTLARVLEEVEHFARRFVVFGSDEQAVAVALWVAHVYAVDAASTTPYLRVTSAAPESGKTRLLEVLWLLLGDDRSVSAVSLSPSTVFRARERRPLAMLIDEVDALAKRKDDVARELLAIVNAGYRLGATVLRSVPQGNSYVTKRFPVFGPTALAGLGRLPDTTESRCVPLVLPRKPAGDAEDFMLQIVGPQAAPLREHLGLWASEEVLDKLREARPDLGALGGLRDRVREVWWPLIAVADLAGGDWPARGRTAAVALHGERAESETSDQILLLDHIRLAFEEDGGDRLPSRRLLQILVANEEGPWGHYWGAEVEREAAPRSAATELARKLRPFGIRPRVVRMPDGSTPRGYHREDFEPVWATYLPPRNTRNTRNAPASDVASVASVASPKGEELRGSILRALRSARPEKVAEVLNEAKVPPPSGSGAWTAHLVLGAAQGWAGGGA